MGKKPKQFDHMLHPYYLIRDKWKNKWQRERSEGMVPLGKYFREVRRESPVTNAFIMRHGDLPNKEIYATKRMVHII